MPVGGRHWACVVLGCLGAQCCCGRCLWRVRTAQEQLRQRYRKIYEDYRPQLMFWKEVLLMRKLLFAVIVVMLNNNIEMQ